MLSEVNIITFNGVLSTEICRPQLYILFSWVHPLFIAQPFANKCRFEISSFFFKYQCHKYAGSAQVTVIHILFPRFFGGKK